MPLSNASLPVIPAPSVTPGVDPSSNYASGPQATAIFNNLDGIQFTFPTLSSAQEVVSIFTGMVTYIPAGTSYIPTLAGYIVNSEISTVANGGVLLELNPIVDSALFPVIPSGVPVPVYILIQGVGALSFRAQMEAIIGSVPDPILDSSWSETESGAPGSVTRTVKEVKYLDRLMIGEKQLPVTGGDPIGLTDLNTSNNPEFTIKMYFSEIQSASPVCNIIKISPFAFIKQFPLFIDPTNSSTGYFSKWTNHPLVKAVEDFKETIVKAYIKFEVWNPDSVNNSSLMEYVPVDSGLTVEMLDYDPDIIIPNPEDLLGSVVTDSNGVASFSVDTTDWGLDVRKDIYFKIIAPTASSASGLSSLPTEWSTKETGIGKKHWLSVQGKKGYYDNFEGHVIGTPTNPLVFRIGLDFHVKFQYFDRSLNMTLNLIDGIPIEFHDSLPIPTILLNGLNYGEPKLSTITSDGKAEFHGVVYSIKPETSIYWRGIYEVKETSLNLNSKVLEVSEGAASGNSNDFYYDGFTTIPRIIYVPSGSTTPPVQDIQVNSQGLSYIKKLQDFKKYNRPSVGSNKKPVIFSPLSSNTSQVRAALYVLKIAKELAHFYQKMTQGNYPGVNNTYRFATLFEIPPNTQNNNNMTAHAVPVDVVQLTDISSNWGRDTIIHESSHHVYWHAVDYSTLDIFGEVLGGELILIHTGSLLHNEEQALIEGFPEAITNIFTGGYYRLFSFSEGGPPGSHPSSWIYGIGLGPDNLASINRGERIEGMFANGIVDLFWNLVVLPFYPLINLRIIESTNGDILTNNSWLAHPGIQANFIKLIWEPLQLLINSNIDPNVSNYLENVINNNPSIAHKIRGILNSYNMAVVSSSITSISPNQGPITGGTIVTIMGANFIEPFTNRLGRDADLEVMFGSFVVQNITVLNDTMLEVIAPPNLASGSVPITITLYLRGFDAFSPNYADRNLRGASRNYTITSSSMTFTYI